MKNNNTILLFDGNALVHRAYHGIPALRTKDGRLVNAVYGFTSSILAAIEEFHPKYIAVAFDVGKITFRNAMYKDYKATRAKTAQELYNQFPLVKEVCSALNIPQFGVPNYEADDVIGTISKIATSKNLCHCEPANAGEAIYNNSDCFVVQQCGTPRNDNKSLMTIIVTGDMDTLQLITDSTSIYSMSRGVNKAVLYDAQKVREKYGIDPKNLIDYKGLCGDPSDNIPGVPGIGDKTAAKFIREFGDLDEIYDNLPNLPDKISKLLLEYKDQAFLSKKLATIDCNVPLDFDLAQAKITDYDKEKAIALFKKLEFESLIKRLPINQ